MSIYKSWNFVKQFFFSFKQRNTSHALHLIWGRWIPHKDHVFYHNWASEPPDFLSKLTEERKMSTTFSFLMQLMEHMIMVSYVRRTPTSNERLCYPSSKIFALVILLKVINVLHNARSIKPKKILCHQFFWFSR